RAFTFPVTNLGFIGEDRLNTLYNQSAAALVVSLTNCSLLPLEIMATGCPVVVTAGENNEKILPPDSAIFALASPHHLAKALEQAVKHPPKQEDLIAAAHQFSWEAETARVEAILKRIALARAGS
ncbi:MAG TPA: glycosyltransferase, partial [Dehalococcoidia bacterium]|nr:glycosyltransferase [Dehalococcoidia bacterium]